MGRTVFLGDGKFADAERLQRLAYSYWFQSEDRLFCVVARDLAMTPNLSGKIPEEIEGLKSCISSLENLAAHDWRYIFEITNFSEMLGLVYFGLEEFQDAETCLDLSLKLRDGMYGSDNPLTLTAMSYLDQVYRQQGRVTDAETLQHRR